MIDTSYRREWLEQVMKAANVSGTAAERFSDEVFARLEKGAQEYGPDGYLKRTLRQLIGELKEEAADVAGWGLLTSRRIFLADLDEPGELQTDLIEIAALALTLWLKSVEFEDKVREIGDELFTTAPNGAPYSHFFEA